MGNLFKPPSPRPGPVMLPPPPPPVIPQTPAVKPAPVVAPVKTSDARPDSVGAGDQPESKDSSAAVRETVQEARTRSRLATVATGWRGVLSRSRQSAMRKSLLGE